MTETDASPAAPGFRRCILIEPSAGAVRAELEDDYHRMVVALAYANGIIIGIERTMKRAPWTTCDGAMAQVNATFLGNMLADPSVREEKGRNCTHLFGLATFAADHGGENAAVAYEVEGSDQHSKIKEAARTCVG